MSSAPGPTRYAEVAVDGPFRGGLTWAVPDELTGSVHRGSRVLVPFRQRATSGLVLALRDTPPEGVPPARIRAISDVLHPAPLPEALLETCLWIARYYHAPVGEVMRMALPAWSEGRAQRRVWRIAEARTALPPAQKALLASLPATPPGVPTDQLARSTKRFRHLDLDALESAGLAQSEYSVDAPSRRPLIERTIQPGEVPADARPGTRQRAVLDFLSAHGDTTDDELRALLGTPLATLRTLAERGWIRMTEREVPRDPFARVGSTPAPCVHLHTEQEAAVVAITQALDEEAFAPFLLHGITGSGKTEVYLRAAEHAIRAGRQVLVLLPEIALTPQIVARFKSPFGERIAVLHSGLTDAERLDAWRRIQAGDVDVVIGARSALFSPLPACGLLVVDEEHDTSYKQEDGVRYHARDSALVLARHHKAVVVLGSATPSLESWHNAQSGRYGYLRLAERANQRPLPEVQIIDRRTCPPVAGDPLSEVLSEPMQLAVRQTVAAGHQAILFLNRRGYAPTFSCRECGETLQCPSCDVSLTWHRRGSLLKCHWCGFQTSPPSTCPTCSSVELEPAGVGTEQVEELVAEGFSDLRVLRMDRDSARGTRLFSLLDRFRRGEADVLVGTQMLAKGHDFPNVALVGVLQADHGLRFPDFRSGERTFQLLCQVAGRAGRAEVTGRVLVQSWQPEHFVLQCAAHHDEDGYRQEEMQLRSRMGYPPFGHMVAIRMDAEERPALDDAADQVARVLQQALGTRGALTGPVDAPLSRLRNRYRRHILLRSAERAPLHHALSVLQGWLEKWTSRPPDVRLHVDVDPHSLL